MDPSLNPNEKNQVNIKRLEEELSSTNPKVFQGIDNKKKNEILRTITSTSLQVSHHRGPLPPADELEKYNNAIPDGANRIMLMAEAQQAHRMKLESDTIGEQMRQSGRGQNFGFIIGIIALLVGGAVAMYGHEITGSVIGGGGITGLVSVFVYGKRAQRKSMENKNQIQPTR
jgi:uncharacterized membrane protein